MTAARLDLTSFLDVLTIILLALLVAQRDVDAAAEAENEEAIAELAEAADGVRSERDAAQARLGELERQLAEARSELDRLRAAEAQHRQEQQALDAVEALSPRERAATSQLLSQALTVVYFEVRADSVVSFRRLGEDAPSALAASVPLTRRLAQPNLPPVTEYVGDTLQRLAASLDNALVQRSAEDRVFYVFVDGDGLTTCAALAGLRRELAANPQIVAVLPAVRCE